MYDYFWLLIHPEVTLRSRQNIDVQLLANYRSNETGVKREW